MDNPKSVKIQLPSLQPELAGKAECFHYVYRQQGIRIEHEVLENKSIIHNYGHGGAELSMAYGSSYIAQKMFTIKNDATQIRAVAVLGSSVNALFTALELIKRGYRVTLYSNEVPQPQQKYQPKSRRGYQFWYPGNYDNCDPLKHELICKLSFEFYKECIVNNRYRSMSWINCYANGPKAEDIRQFITQFVIEDMTPVQVDFGVQQLEQFIKFTTILFNTELLMTEIMTELQLRNTYFCRKSFHKQQDILSVPEDYIFNCLGVESRDIFGDAKIQAIRTHHIDYPISVNNPEDCIIWQSSQDEKQHDLILVLRKKSVAIGGTWEEDKQEDSVDQATVDRLFSRAYHYMKERTTKPIKL